VTQAVFIGVAVPAHPSSEVTVLPANVREPLPPADIVVLDVAAMSQHSMSIVSQLKIDLRRALERGSTLVLLFGPGFAQGYKGQLMGWLRGRLGFTVSEYGEMDIKTTDQSLRGYFDDQLAYGIINAAGEQARPRQVLALGIASNGQLHGSVAELRHDGAARVVLLPNRSPLPESFVDSVLECVSRLPTGGEYPAYLDDLVLKNEPELREELVALAARRVEIEEELERLRATKRILYLTDKALEPAVVRFLTEELGIPARHAGGSDEDFWLTDTDAGDWCIGEVGSFASGSVDRQKVGRLDDHRKQAGKSDDFPALLVANTVHRRQTVAERDEPIAPNVRERAADDHVLIVRTLDLFRLKQLDLRGESATEQFFEAIRHGGGWFEVDADLAIHVHES
jgi:hypothetical protein